MTNEEMQKIMSFIAQQRAGFLVNIQKLEETQRQAKERIEETEGSRVNLVNVVGQLAEVQKRIKAGSQLATELAEAQKRTKAAQAEGRKRLNSLIIVVERYYSNERGKNRSGRKQ